MSEVYKCRYKLETLSALALSPRAQSGFYRNIHFQANELGKRLYGNEIAEEEIPRIIYPFYQYGAYQKYNPEQAQYYIPGSSIKGAMATNQIRGFLVDDIMIDSKYLELRTLCKVQHIPDTELVNVNRKAMKIKEFFPNVAMEILKPGIICSGNFVFPQNPTKILEKVKAQTEEKLEQMAAWLERILMSKSISEKDNGYETEKKCRDELHEMKNHLEDLLEESKTMHRHGFLLLLGGYKGLVLSGVYKAGNKSSIYIDEDRKLPYGIVTLSLLLKNFFVNRKRHFPMVR